jgi:hypothetical protein
MSGIVAPFIVEASISLYLFRSKHRQDYAPGFIAVEATSQMTTRENRMHFPQQLRKSASTITRVRQIHLPRARWRLQEKLFRIQ